MIPISVIIWWYIILSQKFGGKFVAEIFGDKIWVSGYPFSTRALQIMSQ